MQALDRVTVHAPTLAVLLQSALTCGRACDGLLLGTVTTRQTVQAHDTQEAVLTEEHVGHVSGALASASTGSFYDGAGAIDASRLDELCRAASGSAASSSSASASTPEPLGWFAYRPGTLERPSLREAAVTAALQRHLAAGAARGSGSGSGSGGGRGQKGGGAAASPKDPPPQPRAERPVVFLLVTSGAQHGGATLTLSYRAFQLPAAGGPLGDGAAAGGGGSSVGAGQQQQHPQQQHQPQGQPLPPPPLRPVELCVVNLGKVLSAAHASAPFEAPALAAALSGGGPPLPGALEKRLRDLAAGGGAGEAAEAVCGAMLAELRELSAKVGAGTAALAAARERNERLVEALAARQRGGR